MMPLPRRRHAAVGKAIEGERPLNLQSFWIEHGSTQRVRIVLTGDAGKVAVYGVTRAARPVEVPLPCRPVSGLHGHCRELLIAPFLACIVDPHRDGGYLLVA